MSGDTIETCPSCPSCGAALAIGTGCRDTWEEGRWVHHRYRTAACVSCGWHGPTIYNPPLPPGHLTGEPTR
jgi:hypothetical protein